MPDIKVEDLPEHLKPGPHTDSFEACKRKQDADGVYICMYYHLFGNCSAGDNCRNSHSEDLKLTDQQKEHGKKEMTRLKGIRQLKKGKGKGKKEEKGKGKGKDKDKRSPSAGAGSRG